MSLACQCSGSCCGGRLSALGLMAIFKYFTFMPARAVPELYFLLICQTHVLTERTSSCWMGKFHFHRRYPTASLLWAPPTPCVSWHQRTDPPAATAESSAKKRTRQGNWRVYALQRVRIDAQSHKGRRPARGHLAHNTVKHGGFKQWKSLPFDP